MADEQVPSGLPRRTFLAGLAGMGGLALSGCGSSGSSNSRRPEDATTARLSREQRVEVERSDATGPLSGGSARALGIRPVIWSVDVEDPLLTITFDDGPDPEFTPKVLEILSRLGIKATFNVMGYNADRHADVLHATVSAGHEIGNHTMTHRDLAFVNPAATRREIQRGSDAIEAVTGTRPRFFRPPRGELTGTAVMTAAELGHDILLYSLVGDVSGLETPGDVRSFVEPRMKKGLIVAFHDGIGRGTFTPNRRFARELRERRAAEIAALPAILESTLERGLQIVPAGQLVDRAVIGRPA